MKKATFSLLTMLVLAASAYAADIAGKSLVLKTKDGLAIQGYDPVAYFTDNKALKGNVKFTSEYGGAKNFSSAPNTRGCSTAIPRSMRRLMAATAVTPRASIVCPPSAPSGFKSRTAS
jgi:hypothetical protein